MNSSRVFATGIGQAETEQFESLAAQQLRAGFPWLRFRQPLEREFRQSYRDQIHGQLRFNLWLSLLLVGIFFTIGYVAFDHNLNAGLDRLRAAVVLPSLVLALAVLHSRYYLRVFDPLMQVLAPAFGICVVIEAMIAAEQGVSVFSVMVLTLIGLYLMVGLLFYAALRTGLIMCIAYGIGAVYVKVPADQIVYHLVVLVAANIVGGTVCYALEKVHRTHYLEARLLTEMACRDGLTGIYNRRMLDEHLDKAWQQAGRERVPVALLLVDIDCFKSYNDYFGHQAGDECLKQVAHRLIHCARRPLDFSARYGGEEFAIVLYDANRDYVQELSQQIHSSVRQLQLTHPASTVDTQLTVSIGAACVLPQTDRSRFGLVQLADEALYAAKDAGRNRTVLMDKEYSDLATGSFRNRSTAASG
jgi:diguanylate cyclase (GGDEF)-like protein